MRVAAGLFVILSLAACSKPETPPAVSAAPAKSPAPSSSAAPIPPAAQPTPPTPVGAELARSSAASDSAALLKQGEDIFNSTCATCHMTDGGGVPNMQPSIIGSAWISNPDPQLLLSLILRGSAILGEAAQAYSNDMAPQDHLTDAEIAAVATHVRAHFAATPIAKPVTAADVAIARARPGLPQ